MNLKQSYNQSATSNSVIAIIGMGCQYPGANELRQLWENILARRRQFRRFPDCRLPLSKYYDSDPKTPDKTYGSRAAVIDGYEFDWVKKRIPKTTFESTDIVHWLALDVALKALKDAGYDRNDISNEKSGVILGNTLTGEQTRSSTMRLRWPYVKRALYAAAKVRGLPFPMIEELTKTMETFYKSVFPKITEDSLAGGLSNTIAGRICNFLNFDGGGYTVDGACSSSLIAVSTAATALSNGDLDFALAGGVDISLDTFELIGFAKAGALTGQDMNVYDRQASGFLPGEGCGFVAMKRLEDAIADGNYIYATINGWGISSDGKGGITAPSSKGQSKALQRAYVKAKYDPRHLDFIEGHGTGTPVGDRAELEGIAACLNLKGEARPRSVGVTSFKSLVGHTKAAAGVGGLIKAVIGVNQRILPPTAGCKDASLVFENSTPCIYPILQGEIRSQTEKLRAGVSAMGFGGINCHVTIESGDAPASHLKPSLDERALLVSNQKTEVFLFDAASIQKMLEITQALAREAEGMSIAEMVDLAVHLTGQQNSQHPIRAAIITDTPENLIALLQQLEAILQDKPPAKGEIRVSPQREIWIGNSVKRNKVGFLFPGQGSQKLNMARTLVERYPWARKLLAQADEWLQEIGTQPVSPLIYRSLERATNEEQLKEWSEQLASTEVAQPAICIASLLWKNYLKRLGIEPVAVGGHSLGELTAFHAAGVFDEKALLSLAAVRGKAMSVSEEEAGTMASLGCSVEIAEELLKEVDGYAVVANINSHIQTVISGEQKSVEAITALAEARNIQVHLLRVSNAFHSEMVLAAAMRLRQEAPIPQYANNITTQLVSGINGQLVQPGIDLHEHFANQATSQVNFVALVTKIIQNCDMVLEVGTGKIVSNLASIIAQSTNNLCFSLESKPQADRDLNIFLGAYFVNGGEVNWKLLYENRLINPFVPASKRLFINNPCERDFPTSLIERTPISQSFFENVHQSNLELQVDEDVLEEVLSDYFSERSLFLAELIQADLENLSTSSKLD